MNGASTDDGKDPVDEFSVQARQAGLTLPRRLRTKPTEVAAIVAVILLISVGVGVATGWMNLRPSSSTPPGLFGTQACAAQAGQRVSLLASTPSTSDPMLLESWTTLSDQFLASYGSCVQVQYTPSAPSAGLQALASRSADFAVLEATPTPEELQGLPDPAFVLPIGITSVTIVYNLPGGIGPLNLNGSVLSGIYSGSIRQWNDPALEALNPTLPLPQGLPISVLTRTDPAPVNTAFSGFLSESSEAWNSTYGTGNSIAWPVGTGFSSGAALVAALANDTGGIGYVQTGTPLPTDLGSADIENSAGNFTAASISAVEAAASGSTNATQVAGGNWTGASLLNAAGGGSYPLSFYSYLVVYRDLGTAFGGQLSLVSAQWELTFLWWVLTDGGYVTSSWGFDQIPMSIVVSAQIVMQKVAYDGKSVLDTEAGESGGETGEF